MDSCKSKRRIEVTQGKNFYWITFYLLESKKVPCLKIKIIDPNFDESTLYECYEYSFNFSELKESNPDCFSEFYSLDDCFKEINKFLDDLGKFYIDKISDIVCKINLINKEKTKGMNFILAKEDLGNKEILNVFWETFQNQKQLIESYEERISNLEKKYKELEEIINDMNNNNIRYNNKQSRIISPINSFNILGISSNLHNKDNNKTASYIKPSWLPSDNFNDEKCYYLNDFQKNTKSINSQDEYNENLKTIQSIPLANKLEAEESICPQEPIYAIRKKVFYKDNDANISFKTIPKYFLKEKVIFKNCRKFTAFNNSNSEQILVYTDEKNNINVYSLSRKTKINTFIDPNIGIINSCRYYKNIKSQEDLILISSTDCVKMWNIYEKENSPKYILKLPEVYSICLLSHESLDNNYLITCSQTITRSNIIEMWDLNNLSNCEEEEEYNISPSFEIKSKSEVYFIDTYFTQTGSIYIINGNFGSVESHLFSSKNEESNQIFIKRGLNSPFNNVLVSEDGIKTKIIGSTESKIIIWDFYNASEIADVKMFGKKIRIRDLCLWNSKYLMVCCKEEIKIIDIEKKEEECSLKDEDNMNIRNLRKVRLNEEGESFLISDSGGEKNLTLWLPKNIEE